MRILAIDPGHEQSAYVLYDVDARRPLRFGKFPNAALLSDIRLRELSARVLIIEQIASYGMAVGAEVFETVYWSGRFAQAWEDGGGSWDRVKRMQVKMHLCHDSRAKDGNIRAALIDRFGPGRDAAIGRKATPGPLYGVASDVWAALAVAVTYADRMVLAATPKIGATA